MCYPTIHCPQGASELFLDDQTPMIFQSCQRRRV